MKSGEGRGEKEKLEKEKVRSVFCCHGLGWGAFGDWAKLVWLQLFPAMLEHQISWKAHFSR